MGTLFCYAVSRSAMNRARYEPRSALVGRVPHALALLIVAMATHESGGNRHWRTWAPSATLRCPVDRSNAAEIFRWPTLLRTTVWNAPIGPLRRFSDRGTVAVGPDRTKAKHSAETCRLCFLSRKFHREPGLCRRAPTRLALASDLPYRCSSQP